MLKKQHEKTRYLTDLVCAYKEAHWFEGYSGYFGQKHAVNVGVLSQIGLAHLADSWMTPCEQYRGMKCFSSVSSCFFSVGAIRVYWVEFFLPIKLQNGDVNLKTSPAPESTK